MGREGASRVSWSCEGRRGACVRHARESGVGAGHMGRERSAPMPLPLVKSPPWAMKPLMTRWKLGAEGSSGELISWWAGEAARRRVRGRGAGLQACHARDESAT
jgi:hypothetical protein